MVKIISRFIENQDLYKNPDTLGISIIFFFKLKHLTHLDIVSVIERLLPKQTGSEIDQLIKLLW
jgi:hypothetical protein